VDLITLAPPLDDPPVGKTFQLIGDGLRLHANPYSELSPGRFGALHHDMQYPQTGVIGQSLKQGCELGSCFGA
jgi:hypothetical protein